MKRKWNIFITLIIKVNYFFLLWNFPRNKTLNTYEKYPNIEKKLLKISIVKKIPARIQLVSEKEPARLGSARKNLARMHH